MRIRWLRNACFGWLLNSALTSGAAAQSSSLYGVPGIRPALTLEDSSWTFLKVDPIREVQVNDIVTVVVSASSQVLSQGAIQRRTQANADLYLQNWVQGDGFGIQGTNPAIAPRIRGQNNTQYRTTAQLDAQDSMKFRIAARVVDIRPNGCLVLEAHDVYRKNGETWERTLSGITRREDVLPNNTVMSEDIYELNVMMKEKGHIREAYERGWLFKVIDYIKPF